MIHALSIAAGFASGFGATTTSIGGPPMALLYQDASGPSLRGTLAGFFAVGNLLSMVTLTVVGELGSWELFTGLLFVPAVFAGFRLSVLVTPVLDRGYTRPVVLTVSVAGALGVLLRALS